VICTICKCKFSCRNRKTCPRCETPLTEISNRVFLQYTYYHCSRRSRGKCAEPSIEAGSLEQQIAKRLECIRISTEFKDWALKYLHEVHRDQTNTFSHVTQSRGKAYADCCKRLENLVKLKTSPENTDGRLLSDEEYGSQRQTLLEEKKRFGESTPDHQKTQSAQALRKAEEAFEFAHLASKKFAEGDFRIKKQILADLASNLIANDKKLIIQAKKPFKLQEVFLSPARNETEVIEPEIAEAGQGQNGRNAGAFSTVLRELKDVRTYGRRERNLVKSIYDFFRSSSDPNPSIWN